MNKTRASFVTVCSLAMLVVGCGKKEPAPAGAATSGAASSTTAPATGRAIEITGNDTMKFSVTEIRAKAGETLSVTLVNVGTMPKLSMGHNWVLMKSQSVVDAFVAESPMAATTDYVPQNRKGDIIAHTKMLGPKERDTVTFKAPSQPGKYPYLCSFPGHYQVGMKGELIVE